ncbi:YbbR-like protein [Clostridium tepidiprofundi DSM 19306]|uniref:YbbR-like protein n=1 Tax=Clostridium tepidiprofundi DSM 19306 TaxID=1121338 RepID=A0A151B5P1_9CLOT|nr:CdaR family protein [Clostridium tepidiprofundi]KYH35241.1 YbbR-like protein [Clostridium tepidiprofundi DSM 19306]
MEKENKNQWIIKICCVFAAFVLWLYISNMENPVITYTLKNVPVELKNVDSLSQYKLVLTDKEEHYVNLSLRGIASDVYKLKPDDFKIVADLSAYRVKNGENRIPIEIKKSPENVSINNSNGLWVSVDLDELIEKTVPVKINVQGKVAEGYYAYNPIIKPTDVIVYGASKYVNAVSKVEADVYINKEDKDITVSTALMAVDLAKRSIKNVKIQPNFVDVLIPIKKIKTVDVKIETKGELNKKYVLSSINLDIDKVLIVGDKDILKRVNYLKTEPIDLSKVNESTVKEVKLIVPDGIKLVNDTNLVNANIEIEKIAYKNLTLNIDIKNLAEQYEAELDSNDVSLVIQGVESDINALYDGIVKCQVDLTDLGEGKHVIPIEVDLPKNLTIISQNHKTVNVTIKKKDETNGGKQ